MIAYRKAFVCTVGNEKLQQGLMEPSFIRAMNAGKGVMPTSSSTGRTNAESLNMVTLWKSLAISSSVKTVMCESMSIIITALGVGQSRGGER